MGRDGISDRVRPVGFFNLLSGFLHHNLLGSLISCRAVPMDLQTLQILHAGVALHLRFPIALLHPLHEFVGAYRTVLRSFRHFDCIFVWFGKSLLQLKSVLFFLQR